jgi:two-component system NtrC family sensor kinase
MTSQLRESYANLEQKVEERTRELSETLQQQTATGEILSVISSSPTDTQPVFDAIVRSSVKLCDGIFGAVYLLRGGLVHLGAHHNFSPALLEGLRQVLPAPPTRNLGAGRAILTQAVVHIPDRSHGASQRALRPDASRG